MKGLDQDKKIRDQEFKLNFDHLQTFQRIL